MQLQEWLLAEIRFQSRPENIGTYLVFCEDTTLILAKQQPAPTLGHMSSVEHIFTYLQHVRIAVLVFSASQS